MKEFNVNIDGQSFVFNLLKMKDGQVLKTPQGDIISAAVLGVQDFSLNIFDFKVSATMMVGAWHNEAKYKGFLNREDYSQSYFSTALQFSETAIPPTFLNQIAFDDNYLFGVEFTETFMRMLLALPDGAGGTFGDRWEIFNEQ